MIDDTKQTPEVADGDSWEEIQTKFESPQDFINHLSDKKTSEILELLASDQGIEFLKKMGYYERLEKYFTQKNQPATEQSAKPAPEKSAETAKTAEETVAQNFPPEYTELIKKIAAETALEQMTRRELAQKIENDVAKALEKYKPLLSQRAYETLETLVLSMGEEAAKNNELPNWDALAEAAFNELYGRPISELVGKNLTELMSRLSRPGDKTATIGSSGTETKNPLDVINEMRKKMGLPPFPFINYRGGGEKE